MTRWPIIRHIRYFWHLRRMEQHYRAWAQITGMYSPNQSDIDALEEIWKGNR